MKKVYLQEGIKGVYAGFYSCLFGIFLYRGFYFGIYDTGKTIFLTEQN